MIFFQDESVHFLFYQSTKSATHSQRVESFIFLGPHSRWLSGTKENIFSYGLCFVTYSRETTSLPATNPLHLRNFSFVWKTHYLDNYETIDGIEKICKVNPHTYRVDHSKPSNCRCMFGSDFMWQKIFFLANMNQNITQFNFLG